MQLPVATCKHGSYCLNQSSILVLKVLMCDMNHHAIKNVKKMNERNTLEKIKLVLESHIISNYRVFFFENETKEVINLLLSHTSNVWEIIFSVITTF